MWFNETLASGMAPYHHIIGGENGLGEDRRWLEPAHEYFTWMAKHDAHFRNKRSIANIGVVMGQRTHLFYRPPRGAQMAQYMNGLYYALLEGRFLFDFVHEDKLAPEDLKKYSALLLPNTALLSDRQCEQLKAYVDAGGSLLATFETGLYTERNQPRADFGLGDVFGIRKAGDIVGYNRQCLSGAHREATSHSRWLREYALDPGRGKQSTGCRCGCGGADGSAWVRCLSTGAFLSYAATYG